MGTCFSVHITVILILLSDRFCYDDAMRGLSESPVQAFQQNSLNPAAASSISSGIIIPSIIRSIIRIHMGAGM